MTNTHTIELTTTDITELLEALDRAAEDLSYAHFEHPENGYDDVEVNETLNGWRALSERLQAVAYPATTEYEETTS